MINRVQVQIAPQRCYGDGFYELSISVRTGLKEYHAQKLLDENQLLSFYDQIFDEAKRLVKEEMLRDL